MKWGYSYFVIAMFSCRLFADLAYYDPENLVVVESTKGDHGYQLYEAQDREGRYQFSFEDNSGKVLAYFKSIKEKARRQKSFLVKKPRNSGVESWYEKTTLLGKLGITDPDTNNPDQVLNVDPSSLQLISTEIENRMRMKEVTYTLSFVYYPLVGDKLNFLFHISKEFYDFVAERKKVAQAKGLKMSIRVLSFEKDKKTKFPLPFSYLASISQEKVDPRPRAHPSVGRAAEIPTARAVAVPPRELNYSVSLVSEDGK